MRPIISFEPSSFITETYEQFQHYYDTFNSTFEDLWLRSLLTSSSVWRPQSHLKCSTATFASFVFLLYLICISVSDLLLYVRERLILPSPHWLRSDGGWGPSVNINTECSLIGTLTCFCYHTPLRYSSITPFKTTYRQGSAGKEEGD